MVSLTILSITLNLSHSQHWQFIFVVLVAGAPPDPFPGSFTQETRIRGGIPSGSSWSGVWDEGLGLSFHLCLTCSLHQGELSPHNQNQLCLRLGCWGCSGHVCLVPLLQGPETSQFIVRKLRPKILIQSPNHSRVSALPPPCLLSLPSGSGSWDQEAGLQVSDSKHWPASLQTLLAPERAAMGPVDILHMCQDLWL